MDSEVRIFFDERVVTISSAFVGDSAVFDGLYFDGAGSLDGVEIQSIMNTFKGNLYVRSEDPERTLHKLFQSFKIIPAAGGLVKSDKGLLWIFRLGKWDLPKGKVEEGEALELAAEREIIEECGNLQLELHGHLGTTYHCYEQGGEMILKPTHWYGFTTNDIDVELVPQKEEGITKVKWVSVSEMDEVMESTYASIRDLMASLSGTFLS